ncbi:MAG: EamA family transporter [Planctomycetes bacterium]|nr:EamA family transporter [Planctomycetota bacterium]
MTGYPETGPPRGALLAAFAAIYVLWGANFLAIRYAAEAMPPFLLMGFRSLAAGAILYGWARVRRGERPGPGHWRVAAGTGALLFVGCHGLLAWAERTVPSGVAALFMATIPVWMTLLDAASGGPRPAPAGLAGLGLSLLGLVLLVGPVPSTAPGPGILALLVSAFAWASGSILSRRLNLPRSLTLATGMQLLAGGTALVVAGLALGEAGRLEPRALGTRALLSLAYMVGAASLIGFTAYTWLLRVSTPARVGTYAFVNPVVALLVGWAIGGERLDAPTLGAALVVVMGVALTVRTTRVERGGEGARAADCVEPTS